MNFKSFSIILSRQFRQKWGRFLLASGGIMIGIWAITLTTSLSLGVQQTIIKAINSRPEARQMSIAKTTDGKKSLLELTGSPKYIGINKAKIENLKNEIPNVIGSSPNVILGYYLPTSDKPADFDCVTRGQSIRQAQQAFVNPATTLTPKGVTDSAPTINLAEVSITLEEFSKFCPEFQTTSSPFEQFYESNRSKWLGSTTTPKDNEIILCYRCGNLNLDEKLKLTKPEDLLDRIVNLNYSQSPTYLKPGEVYDVITQNQGNTAPVTRSNTQEFKVVGVIDDREAGVSSSLDRTYINFKNFEDAIVMSNPGVDLNTIEYLRGEIFTKGYEDLNPVIQSLRDRGYLVASIAEILIQSVSLIFAGLTIVLAGFGFIALIASIFGIINVMTISVLERQKEIGILKSLGAKNRDIFIIFMLESALLGFIGWILGTLLALAFGYGIQGAFQLFYNSSEQTRTSLDNVNISRLDISFPWWLLLGTLAISLLFTILSGVFPALRAARQNPVEVLRAE